MQLHELQPQRQKTAKQRVGRGGKRGTFSGRGVKGQKSRAGRKMPPAMRELIKRYHKLRGYRQVLKPKLAVDVTLKELSKKFQDGAIISPAALVKERVIRRINGRIPSVKILGTKDFAARFIVRGCMMTAGVKAQMEKAGGSVK